MLGLCSRFLLSNLAIWQFGNLAIWQSGNLQRLPPGWMWDPAEVEAKRNHASESWVKKGFKYYFFWQTNSLKKYKKYSEHHFSCRVFTCRCVVLEPLILRLCVRRWEPWWRLGCCRPTWVQSSSPSWTWSPPATLSRSATLCHTSSLFARNHSISRSKSTLWYCF